MARRFGGLARTTALVKIDPVIQSATLVSRDGERMLAVLVMATPGGLVSLSSTEDPAVWKEPLGPGVFVPRSGRLSLPVPIKTGETSMFFGVFQRL